MRFEEDSDPRNERSNADEDIRKYRQLEVKKMEMRMSKRENLAQTRQ